MLTTQVLIRNLRPEVVARLKERATKNRRSLEGELREVLVEASYQPSQDIFEQLRALDSQFAGRTFSDSAALIREDRDSR